MLPLVARLGEEISFTCKIVDFKIEVAKSKSKVKVEKSKCVCFWGRGVTI